MAEWTGLSLGLSRLKQDIATVQRKLGVRFMVVASQDGLLSEAMLSVCCMRAN